MKRMTQWVIAAILICGAMTFAACSSSDGENDNKQPKSLSPEKLVGFWVADYAESMTEDGKTWTRVVEDYFFRADGTGYYECYLLNGDKYVDAESVRDEGTLHYTISGNTITVTGDIGNMKWTLTYADDKLTESEKMNYSRATAVQQAMVDQLYADWQGDNSDE